MLDGANLEETMVALNTLGDEYRRQLMYRHRTIFVRALTSFIPGGSVDDLDSKSLEFLNVQNLQNAKVVLGRLSGMLDYAASDLEEVEHIDDMKYRQHFDPSQVSKTRIQTLLDRLQQQLNALPEGEVRNNLIQNVKDLKEEVKRPRPKWRSIITNAILILGIVADVKTMHPQIGSEIMDTIDAVVQTIVTESQVSQQSIPLQNENGGPKHWAIRPKLIEHKKDEKVE